MDKKTARNVALGFWALAGVLLVLQLAGLFRGPVQTVLFYGSVLIAFTMLLWLRQNRG